MGTRVFLKVDYESLQFTQPVATLEYLCRPHLHGHGRSKQVLSVEVYNLLDRFKFPERQRELEIKAIVTVFGPVSQIHVPNETLNLFYGFGIQRCKKNSDIQPSSLKERTDLYYVGPMFRSVPLFFMFGHFTVLLVYTDFK